MIPRRILLIQLRRHGDVVLTTALLEDLRRHAPDARVDFLVGAAAAPLLDGHPLIDERIVYDRAHPVRAAVEVRRRHYDWIIDVQSSPRTAQLVLVSGAPVRVGWAVRGWGWVYTHALPRAGRAPEWVVRERQRLLALAGVAVQSPPPRPQLVVSAAEGERAEQDVREWGAPAGAPRVGMLLSAGELSKEWGPASFAALARLLQQDGTVPVVFQGPGDEARLIAFRAALAADARSAQGAAPLVIAPPLDVRRFLAALGACDVLVAGDTGPVHMATAIGVPTVTIFGPTSPVAWSPGLSITVVVRDGRVPCLGCRHAVCPIGHDCMTGVDATTVAAQVRALMQHAGHEP